MITSRFDGAWIEYRGLSTDTKPTATNGDLFVEIDTGKIYFYDEDGSDWVEFGAGE